MGPRLLPGGRRGHGEGMSSGGAPTGKWASLPTRLEEGRFDLAATAARLVVRRPDLPPVEIPLEKAEFLIGRSAAEVDLALDDDRVSRRHACLSCDDRGYFKLEDLGSRNGIRYAGRQVRRLNLIDGDEFGIGRTDFTFHARMARFAPREAEGRAPDRADSVMADVEIPEPSTDRSEELDHLNEEARDRGE